MADIIRRDYGTDHPIFQNPHTSSHPILFREFLEWIIRVANARPDPLTFPTNNTPNNKTEIFLAKVDTIFKDRILFRYYIGSDGLT